MGKQQGEWVGIAGWPRYEVSDRGRVRSFATRSGGITTKPTLLKPDIRNGYKRVTLCGDGQTARFFIHGLVLMAFVGPRPEGMEAGHLDGNASNNNLSNLRWITHSENTLQAYGHGTMHRGEDHHLAKLKEHEVMEIRASTGSSRVLGRFYDVDKKTILDIRHGRTWKHVQ